MANQLKISSYYKNTSWIVESEVTDTSDEDFPKDIFLWTVKSDGSLDEFQAIGHVDQVAKYPLYNPSRTSNFGIHLVRSNTSYQRVSTEQERDDVITVLKKAFDTLNKGYEVESQPIEEVYP